MNKSNYLRYLNFTLKIHISKIISGEISFSFIQTNYSELKIAP